MFCVIKRSRGILELFDDETPLPPTKGTEMDGGSASLRPNTPPPQGGGAMRHPWLRSSWLVVTNRPPLRGVSEGQRVFGRLQLRIEHEFSICTPPYTWLKVENIADTLGIWCRQGEGAAMSGLFNLPLPGHAVSRSCPPLRSGRCRWRAG